MLNKIDIDKINNIAIAAGKAIMEVYQQDFEVIHKEDNSPLTLADKRSNEIILKNLLELHPVIPFISEENKLTAYEKRKNWKYFWLIDPLDGTKEFIKRNGEFTVNIALIHNQEPVLGVVYLPAKDVLYYSKKGEGAFKVNGNGKAERISVKKAAAEMIAIAGSRSHGSEEMIEYLHQKEKAHQKVDFLPAGSSLKFCMVAEGVANEYPRFGPTMEWDTAAGHAVVMGAGGSVTEVGGNKPLLYNKENLLNPYFIVKAE